MGTRGHVGMGGPATARAPPVKFLSRHCPGSIPCHIGALIGFHSAKFLFVPVPGLHPVSHRRSRAPPREVPIVPLRPHLVSHRPSHRGLSRSNPGPGPGIQGHRWREGSRENTTSEDNGGQHGSIEEGRSRGRYDVGGGRGRHCSAETEGRIVRRAAAHPSSSSVDRT